MTRILLLLLILGASTPPDMTINDVAKYLGVTTKTVRVMVADGRLRAYTLGYRIIRFRRSEIDAAMTPIGGGSPTPGLKEQVSSANRLAGTRTV
jgi:excisionase family DNA binding protein